MVRRQRATRLGSPSAGGPSGKGGTNATEASMVDLVAPCEGLEATRAWAQAVLDAFGRMAADWRRTLRGAMLEGLDVAEMKFRIGATDRETAEAFGVSRSKLHTDLAAFIDYLDSSAPATRSGPSPDMRSPPRWPRGRVVCSFSFGWDPGAWRAPVQRGASERLYGHCGTVGSQDALTPTREMLYGTHGISQYRKAVVDYNQS